MHLIRNEYGDIMGWRVALMGAGAVSASVGLAVALFGTPTALSQAREAIPRATVSTVAIDASPGTPEASSGQYDPTDTQTSQQGPQEAPEGPSVYDGDTTAPAVATSGVYPWDAALATSDALACLTPDARSSLAATVGDWLSLWRTTTEGVVVSVDGTPEVTAEATRVSLRVEAPEASTWLEATIPPGGTWQVTERIEDTGGTDETRSVPRQLADTSLLAGIAGEPVAAEVARQLAASGLEGAEGAWTTAEAVSWDGQVLRLTLWLPTGGAGNTCYEASFDTAVGLLEIRPMEGASA